MATIFERFRLKRRQLPDRSPQYEMKLPNFFIIGANKAGTSSLYHYCRQHPEIFMSQNKEPMFFTASGPLPTKNEKVVNKPSLYYQYFTLHEYTDLFVSATEPVRGEASTAYLANPNSTMWIRKIIPDAKLIAILRNPIERAISDFQFQTDRNKSESRTLAQAINDALNGYLSPANAKQVGDNLLNDPQRYLNLGLYGHQLSIVKRFFPDNQLFIADYGEYNKYTVEFVQKVYKFLGVGEFIPPDTQRLNVSDHATPHDLSSVLENKMKQYFEKDIEILQSLVNFDVLKWLQ